MVMKLRAYTVPLVIATVGFGAGLVADRTITTSDFQLAQSSTPQPAPLSPAERQKIKSLTFGPDAKSINDLIESGVLLGYDSNVMVGPHDSLELLFVKEEREARGILKAKWSKKETVSLQYVKTGEGYYLANADKTLEEKSPVGDWQIVRKAKDIPAPIWAERLKGESKQ